MTNQISKMQLSGTGKTDTRAVYGTPPLQMVLLGLDEDQDTERSQTGKVTPNHLSKENVVRRIIEHLSKEP